MRSMQRAPGASRQSAVAVECCTSGRYAVQRVARSRPAAGGRASRRKGRLLALAVRAGPVEYDENDLLQAPDRVKWYEAKFAADDMPDWNVGRFLRSQDVAPGVRSVVLECEVSRERVPLRNAYKYVGQRASIRVNQGIEHQLPVHNPPFPQSLNREALFNIRGDLFAHEVKTVKEPTSVLAELHLLVSREEAPEVYNMEIDDGVETGPFVGGGLDLRSTSLMAVYRFPTLVLFVSGRAGISTAKALLEAPDDVASLSTRFRQDVRVYYKVPNKASVCFEEEFEKWEEESMGKVKVMVTTSTFQDAFDDDDTLTYNPMYTAAIIITGGEPEEEREALEVCREAEISEVLKDSNEAAPVEYMASVPTSFTRWVKEKVEVEAPEEPVSSSSSAAANGNGHADRPAATAVGDRPAATASGVGKGQPRQRR